MNSLRTGRELEGASLASTTRRPAVALGRVSGFRPDLFASHMERSGLTVDAVAANTGVSTTAVRGWMSGKYKPSAEACRSLGEILGIDPLELSGKSLVTATLIDLRQRIGLTGTEAAEAADIIPSQIYSLEQAVAAPKMDHLLALAPVYEVSEATIAESWVNRRIERFGTESLRRLPDHIRVELNIS